MVRYYALIVQDLVLSRHPNDEPSSDGTSMLGLDVAEQTGKKLALRSVGPTQSRGCTDRPGAVEKRGAYPSYPLERLHRCLPRAMQDGLVPA
jgi:hypothetical protein